MNSLSIIEVTRRPPVSKVVEDDADASERVRITTGPKIEMRFRYQV